MNWIDNLYPKATPFEKYIMETYGESMEVAPFASHYMPSNLVYNDSVLKVDLNSLRFSELNETILDQLKKAWDAGIEYAQGNNEPKQKEPCVEPKPESNFRERLEAMERAVEELKLRGIGSERFGG